MCAASDLPKRRVLEFHDLLTFLRRLPPSILDNLYGHPATCIAVFRDLPELSRHYVLRMLFVDQAVAQAVVSSWVSFANQSEHVEAVKPLGQLHIWHESPIPGGLPGWKLNSTFKENLRVAILGGGSPWFQPLPPDKYNRDAAFLDKYAMERWECVLHYMVGSPGSAEHVSNDIKDILLNAKLMKCEEGENAPVISAEGFQFLLLDTKSQVWYFLTNYITTMTNRASSPLNLVQVMAFVLQLSFTSSGKDYSTANLTDDQLTCLQHLREFGLIFQRKRKSKRFYPTKLAIDLTSAGGPGDSGLPVSSSASSTSAASSLSTISSRGGVLSSSSSPEKGFIVVETNYHVYAYTDSTLKIALLALFSDMLYRFPNMCVGVITRESVRRALADGITAEQIIHFLKSHAHPEMMKSQKGGVIPGVICDQIRLWEIERDRFVFTEGVLYNQFLSQRDFELLRDYAKEQNCCVWENSSKRVLIVTRQGHDDVRRFWKRHKNQSNDK